VLKSCHALLQDVSEGVALTTWSHWIDIYADSVEDILAEPLSEDDSPRTASLKASVAGQVFAMSLYQGVSADSAVCSSLESSCQTLAEWMRDNDAATEECIDWLLTVNPTRPLTLKQWLWEEDDAVEAFCRSLLDEPSVVEDEDTWMNSSAVRSSNAESSSGSSSREFKYGRCPVHQCAMSPYIFQGGAKAGQPHLILACFGILSDC